MKRILIIAVMGVTSLTMSAKKPIRVVDSKTERIEASSDWDNPENRMHAFIAPYKLEMDVQMVRILGYADHDMTSKQPEDRLTNWCSQVQIDYAVRCQQKAEIGVVNVGGMRCDIPQGSINVRRIYELMPFDNELVVVSMSGEALNELFQSFAKQGGQGIAGARFVIRNGQAYDITVGGEPLDPERTYHIATSDYLAEGNDHMEAFRKGTVYRTGLKLRDIYMDAVLRQKHIDAEIDGRITIEE